MSFLRSRRNSLIHPLIKQSLADTFTDQEMVALSRRGTVATLAAGQRFATEGAVGQEAVVVLEGTADVIRDNAVIATVGAGTVLGELALLTGEPRNASLEAHDELSILVMTRREFNSVLDQCPRLAAQIKNLAMERSAV